MQLADLRPIALFDGLSDTQLGSLIGSGEEVPFDVGETLFREGEPADEWWILIDGSLDLVRHHGHEPTLVARFDVPGQWSGGFRAWDVSGVYLATGVATTPGRMLRVPATTLRGLMADYPLVSHLLDGVFHTARSIESGARQRGALITLGTLAAGLAHEINNPAAAASRAVDTLESELSTLLGSLGRLAQGAISAEQFTGLDELRRQIVPPPAPVDPLAAADREDAMAAWLSRHDVDRGWVVASALADAGADVSWCERAAAVIPGSALGPGLEWVASTLAVNKLLSEVKESTRRVSELVGAVRSYTQLDRAPIRQTDVTEGIESTLVILGHKLRAGVTVVRDYDADLPTIEAYEGELNQVWTNLLDNAIDAMEGTGTLRIRTWSDADAVYVCVADTGPGMPPEVVGRAFDAFFTTKGVGQGTGLGLDIARRIVVERHAGTISVDSHPGATEFQVRLPVRHT